MNNKPFSRLFNSNTGFFLAALFAFSYVSMVFGQYLVGFIELVISVGLAIFNIWQNARKEREVAAYVQSLAFHADYTSKDSLLRFPLPLTVVQPDGKIIWYNEHFGSIMGDKNLFDKYLSDVTGEKIVVNDFIEKKTPSGTRIELDGKHYRVLTNVIKTGSGELFAVLYWMDDTELITIRRMYKESRPVVCIIMIDNYDDVLQSAEENIKALLVANVEKRLSEWAAASGGILKKVERDKFLYIFEHGHLEQYIENRFDILDAIREIKTGSHMPITVSLGIGVGGESITACDNYARAAIDMALGRGGDQVVIKDSTRFVYYGGKSKEMEKRTRVRARVVAFALKELILQAENVLIMGHVKPDLDSLGAALGLYAICRHKGKSAYIVLENVPKTTQRLLSRISADGRCDGAFLTRAQAREMMSRQSLLMVVDVFRPSIVESPELLDRTDNVVVIDHHRKSAEYIENAALTYHETYASSSCELVAELLQYMDDSFVLPPVIAEALYAGIALDTKNFTFKTGIRTFEAAAYLRRLGANITEIKQLFQFGMEFYTLRSEVVKSAVIYREGIAIAVCRSQYEDLPTLCAQSADELMNIEGVAASFVMSAYENNVHISGRSLGGANVQVILEKLGGGGHINMAAAQLGGVPLAEAERMLKGAVDEYLNEMIR